MITIFTPSFNRGYSLERLFDSLQKQSCKDFEWLVIDDGSTDDTKALLQSFAQRADFPMRYQTQKNSGKHVAINRGAQLAKGEWFFIVDSDDWLPNDSIEVNTRYLEQISGDLTFAGVSGLRSRADGSFLVGPGKTIENLTRKVKERFSLEYIDATSQDYRTVYHMPGDRAEIVRTQLVRETPFPVFPDERFVAEYYLWQSLSERELKLRWFNTTTYCGDYLEDGLTSNMSQIMRNSPKGRSFVDNFTLGSHAPLVMKLNSAVNYTRYGRLAGISLSALFAKCACKPLFIAGLPVALALPLHGGENDS